MNITILAVGTKMPRWVTEAVNEYSKRFGRDIHYTLKEIKPEKRGAGTSSAPPKKNASSKPCRPTPTSSP